MSIQVVLIVIGIIFYVVKYLSKDKNESPVGKSGNPQRNVGRPQTSASQKSIDDIFNDFVKEVESVKKKEVKPVQVAQKKVLAKPALDWQKVDTTHIKSKKQLIDHEDYHGVSHRVDLAHQIESIADIKSTEGEVLDFDVNEIDWHKAVIYKEILDRKYA